MTNNYYGVAARYNLVTIAVLCMSYVFCVNNFFKSTRPRDLGWVFFLTRPVFWGTVDKTG